METPERSFRGLNGNAATEQIIHRHRLLFARTFTGSKVESTLRGKGVWIGLRPQTPPKPHQTIARYTTWIAMIGPNIGNGGSGHYAGPITVNPDAGVPFQTWIGRELSSTVLDPLGQDSCVTSWDNDWFASQSAADIEKILDAETREICGHHTLLAFSRKRKAR